MSEKNIILIVPRDHVIADPTIYPNLGLLYIAAVLERGGWSVSVYDMREEKNIIENIPECDIYAFTSSTPQITEVRKNAKILRRKGAFVIIGGHYASWMPESIKDEFDAVVIGEGEPVILDIVNNRKKGIFNSYELTKKQDVNSIPYPARHLLPKNRIINTSLMSGHGSNDNKSISTTMICSRGCPHKCSFCANIPQKVRYRSATNIVGEIEYLIENYNCKSYKFIDDNILSNRKFLRDLCLAIKSYDVTYRCLGRSDFVDDEICQLLKESGCLELALGIETANNAILKKMNKRETVEDHKKAIKLIKKHGMDFRGYFMVGFPDETKEVIEDMKNFIAETDPEKFTVGIFTPYPGCDIYNNPKKYGYEILHKDFEKYYQLYPATPPYNTNVSTSEQIVSYHKEILDFIKLHIEKKDKGIL